MKKLVAFCAIALLCGAMTGCDYDDSDLWNKIEEIDGRVDGLEKRVATTNSDLEALRLLVEALQENVTISAVETTGDGYTIRFSNGTTATISNGRDGVDAPVVSVKQDTDGVWYWTLDGEFITVDGRKLRVEGEKGADGAPGASGSDAVAPQVRIDADTKMWEISTDGGQTWTSTGVVAEGKDGDSVFSDVEDTDTEVIFTLADGETTIVIPKTSATGGFAFVFPETLPKGSSDGTVGVDKFYTFAFGEEKELSFTGDVTAVDVMNVPQGWSAKVNLSAKTVTVTAPAFSGSYYQEGILSLVAIDNADETMLASVRICAVDYSDPEGTFVLNEGNMSSDNGSVIYITAGGQVINYAYWRMNGTELGNVAQDLFITGDKLYIVSQNGGNDGALVETDAKSLKNTDKFSKTDLSLSWPTHVAVVGRTAYIRDNAGVHALDLDTRTLTFIDGTKGALKNRMAVAGGKVFVPASKSIFVLENGALVETIALDGTVTGVINAGEGYLWVSCSTSPAQIIKLNASDYTLDKHTLDAGGVGAGWGATPGISAKGDEIYFTNNSPTIYRHNFTTNTTETLGNVKSQVATWGQLYNMPAVHPVTGDFYYTTIKSFGWDFLINDISVFDLMGEPTMIADYQNYTHFPAGIFFSANFK